MSCRSVSAQCLLSLFQSVPRRGLKYFRVYVPKSIVPTIIDGLGLSEMGDTPIIIMGDRWASNLHGSIGINSQTSFIQIHSADNHDGWHSAKIRSLTGEDVMVEMGIPPQLENYD
ncbi:hypothetical protein PFISCL1PPCAC_21469 [Pristionchus fissidentatus]|uniref:Uncharacterized protein n=1 Tax=Pristionchus fissidentatus TaxID=1538716 RepID=A0AAV5WE59_9BILA|nr:hypothetical protein PFISCL1PPCAC_21469 [Pristionchus fissidentatus]